MQELNNKHVKQRGKRNYEMLRLHLRKIEIGSKNGFNKKKRTNDIWNLALKDLIFSLELHKW